MFSGGGPATLAHQEMEKRQHERFTPFHVKRSVMDHRFENFAGGGALSGPGGGQDDKIPAVIDGHQPAALSSGEYVIDAHTVAAIGGGSTEEGSRLLDAWVKKIRQHAYGKTAQPKKIGAGIMSLGLKKD